MVADVLQRHGHHLGRAVDRDVAEELQAEQGARFSPCSALGLLKHRAAGPKVLSSSVGAQVPAWIGPDTNSQNGSKSWKCARFGIVVVRRRVVHVGGEPHRVADAGMLDERQRSAISSSRPRGGPSRDASSRVGADHAAERHVGGDHLPGRGERHQLTLEPGDLRGAEEIASGRSCVVFVAVRAAVAAHIEHEHVEQRAVGDLAIDAAGLGHASVRIGMNS